jgi:hypothetical protein
MRPKNSAPRKASKTGKIVYENKIVWFLNEPQNPATADGVSIKQTLGISAVKDYVSTIIDVWSFQKSKNINPHPDPHSEVFRSVLRMRTHDEHIRRRLEFTDRAAGTV